jgi:formate dehydrogenase accessory protein FdhE
VKAFWETLIERADELASQKPEARELLSFYAKLLRTQQQIHDQLSNRKGWLPSGVLAQDLAVVQVSMKLLLDVVTEAGPVRLADEARSLSQEPEAGIADLLLEYWRTPSDVQFFGKAFLQPYAQFLVESGVKPVDRNLEAGENRCPFCAGKPQLSVLQLPEPGAEVGARSLQCSMCLSWWPFRRVACVNCGEERPAKIGYFHTPQYEHLRVEACETCQHYIKGIDLTKLGLAVPLVDEVAAAPLDLWAHERGYTKIELNLVGL